MSRPTGGRPAGGPSCACATSPGASATSPASSTSTASSCAIRSPGARCSMRCRCRPGSAMPDGRIAVGQRGLREGRRGRAARARCASARSSCWRCASARRSARRWPRAHPTASACTSSAAARARRTTSSSCRSRAPRVGAAIDVAALETAQGELVRHVAAYERTLDRVATGVAIFGPDQRLTFFNEAYRKLWQLDADWLATKPSDGELLDRLRELSRLPEVGQLPRLEGQDPRRLQDRHGVRGLVAPARRPHHPRRRRRSAPTAASPISTTTPPSASRSRAATMPSSTCSARPSTASRKASPCSPPTGASSCSTRRSLQIWRLSRSTLERGAAHRRDHRPVQRASTTTWPTWARISRAVTGISDRRQPVAGQMIAARSERHRLCRRRRCPTAPRSSPSSTSPTPSATSRR